MTRVGLTEVLAALSLVTNLGSGFPPEQGLRVCLAGMAVGSQADVRDGELADLFQATLLLALGCTAFATENAGYFDDDLAFQRAMHGLDVTDPASLNSFGSWAGEPRADALRTLFLQIAPTVGPQATASACEAARLTDREVDVLRLAARGLSNKGIAETLVVSPRTVQHHLAHIYDKTGRRSRAGNALFAMEHGLLEPAGPERR